MSVILSLIIGEQKYEIKIMKNARCSCKDKRELNVRIKDIYIFGYIFTRFVTMFMIILFIIFDYISNVNKL